MSIIRHARGATTFRQPHSSLRRLTLSLTERAFDTALYRATLNDSVPDAQLTLDPAASPLGKVIDPWAGDPDLANDMFQGRFTAAGHSLRAVGQSPWTVTPPSEAWLAELCRFAWLRHFRAAGGPAAAQLARDLVAGWIASNRRFDALSWRPEILAARLGAWLAHGDFLLQEATSDFQHDFLSSLQSQAHHLARSVTLSAAGAPRLAGLIGLALAGIAFPGRERWRVKAQDLLAQELAHQIHHDGGHYERNPSVHHAILRDLIMVGETLRANGLDASRELEFTVDIMARFLRLFRHGDGRLALFNGSHEDREQDIDATLAAAHARGRPPVSAPKSGFERLQAHRTLVLLDVGAPPPDDVADRAHAGALSFELSVGRERLIVNCGEAAGAELDWRVASRATAAHSTLTVADTNSLEVLADGTIGRRPRRLDAARTDDSDGITVAASHDGYGAPFGLVHHRHLTLAANGGALIGEDKVAVRDVLTLAGHGAPAPDRPFVIRFHLHPSVRASLVKDGSAVLLRLSGRSGWSFTSDRGEISLEDSVYLGASAGMRRTEQIVVSGSLQQTPVIGWALCRVEEGG